ncbi:tRNA modification GTPase [Salinimicrobium soli]|uniref:tRNA modification GTPase n=1 Tax=Salinimicrobium soli TaxID=1254399 RepID=UPI003AAB5186
MNKQLLFLLIAILSYNCYSQISFEKGYFIDNEGNRHEVLIKNEDWRKNPEHFDYKTSEAAPVQTAGIESIEEFGVDNFSKFYRAKVEIDRSLDRMNKLSTQRQPDFKEEVLLLKVLLEGRASLYKYEGDGVTRYFYSNDNSPIEQLVYKKYSTPNMQVGTNNSFRQQLWNDLTCPEITLDRIEKVDYKEGELVKFFREYNECQGSTIVYEQAQKKFLFNLNLRPRINSSSLKIENSASSRTNTDFGQEITFGFGIEAEAILPFHKNKWSVFTEPTYQSFNKTVESERGSVYGGILISKSNYSSLEIPIGVRHYFFLNKNSKIFLNAAYITDFTFGSTIEFEREDGTGLGTLELSSLNNFAIGLGHKFKDKYSMELRVFTDRDVFMNFLTWYSDYKSVSFILGYTLF